LLQLYHGAGDVGARDELVHRFLPLARQLARRYQRRGEPTDDLYQTEIAERVGVSATQVARVLMRSIEALREATTQPDPAA
jgi:DNA-directed RNA polymerase specialized sigma subunit